jgi:hypothetical protein
VSRLIEPEKFIAKMESVVASLTILGMIERRITVGEV